MMSVTQKLTQDGLINPPCWLPPNVQFEVEMDGAGASSDIDLYGFAIPPLSDMFPHMLGEIRGLGNQHRPFEQYQVHHVVDGGKKYDLGIYSIVKYFQLCMENDPDMIGSLFMPASHVGHITTIGQMVRDKRHMFLHKGAYSKFREYAGKRKEMIEKHGFDLKSVYHAARLTCECEQILVLGDIDLQRDRELLNGIREGAWTEDGAKKWFAEREKHLLSLHRRSGLPDRPNESSIKELLIDCLEEHYGRIRVNDAFAKVLTWETQTKEILADLRQVLDKYSCVI